MRELEGYRRRERERLFTDDLAQIRAAHPEESARSVSELGPQYLAICAAVVDPLCAYEAVRSHRDRTAPPPSTGAFGGNTRRAVMDFQAGMEGKTVNGLADRETQQAIAAALAEMAYNDPNSWLVTD